MWRSRMSTSRYICRCRRAEDSGGFGQAKDILRDEDLQRSIQRVPAGDEAPIWHDIRQYTVERMVDFQRVLTLGGTRQEVRMYNGHQVSTSVMASVPWADAIVFSAGQQNVDEGSWSETVFPSSIFPIRVRAPPVNSIASFSVVFPAPLWPTRTTLRMAAGS